jgi:hypothetical protein
MLDRQNRETGDVKDKGKIYEIRDLSDHVLQQIRQAVTLLPTLWSWSFDPKLPCNNLHALHRLPEFKELVNVSHVLLSDLLTLSTDESPCSCLMKGSFQL